jgi:hypothetical protein
LQLLEVLVKISAVCGSRSVPRHSASRSSTHPPCTFVWRSGWAIRFESSKGRMSQ